MNLIIKEVNDQNHSEVLSLKVSKSQEGFIETVKECLDEASEFHVWRPVGIYDEDIIIGFAMYGFLDETFDRHFANGNEQVWFDRFLIDERYQGKGYGSLVLKLLIKRIYEEYECEKIYLSIYEDNEKALEMYKKIGFSFNGEYDTKGEKVMVLNHKSIKLIIEYIQKSGLR